MVPSQDPQSHVQRPTATEGDTSTGPRDWHVDVRAESVLPAREGRTLFPRPVAGFLQGLTECWGNRSPTMRKCSLEGGTAPLGLEGPAWGGEKGERGGRLSEQGTAARGAQSFPSMAGCVGTLSGEVGASWARS